MKTLRTLKNCVSNRIFYSLPGAPATSRIALAFLGLILLLSSACPVSAVNLTWKGSVNGNWDVATTANWQNGGASSTFHNGDSVFFSNSASIFSLSINANVAPAAMLINATTDYTFFGIGSIGGNGGLMKLGTDKLTLSTSNGFAGITLINGGTLALTGNGSLSGSTPIVVSPGTTLDASGRFDGKLTLGSGQTLSGGGSVHGTVAVLAGATVTPGGGVIGTLTLNSNLTLAGNVVMKLNGTTLQNDLITGVNNLIYDGTLTVSNLGGGLAAGETYTLFSFNTFSGNFTSIVGSPGPGLAYSFDPSSGVLSVSNVPPAYSPNVWVNAVQSNLICVHFDQPVSGTLAGDTGNYTLYTKLLSTNIISITNAIVQPDQQTVALYLDGPAGEFFAVSAANIVTNSSGTTVTVNATGYLGDFSSAVIGTSGDPSPAGEVLSLFNDAFNVTSGGSDIGGTNDHCQFVYEQVVGDFDVAAQVTDIQATDPGSKAGLMAREFLVPNSRAVGTFYTALALGLHTNQIQVTERSVSNSAAFDIQNPIPASSLSWLRLTRFNNNFVTYYGTNGLNWTTSSVTSLPLNSSLYVGITGTSHTNGDTSTASFKGFGVTGARPGDGVRPTLSVHFYNKTNMIANWQRTPRDFTVQVGFDLSADTNSTGGSISNATHWAYLMSPVYDTALTGTNAAMPTSGRYMIIPTSLFSNAQVFVRLAQVNRVIPDPPGVTAGTIFSQTSGGAVAPASLNALCGTTIVTTNAIASTGIPIVCPNTPAGKYTYQFTTDPSGSTYNSIISVRAYTAVGASNCDTFFTAGGGKSQVKVTPTPSALLTNYGYTFVAAPTTPAPSCTPVKVRVNIITNF